MIPLSHLFEFQTKSKIKAGDGLPEAKYPFYTSSNSLVKWHDDFLFEGDSLIFGTGGNPSVHFENRHFSVSTDCLVAKPKTEIFNTKYYYYYLKSNMRLLEKGFQGAGLKHISKKYISDIKLPVVDIDIQNNVVNILNKIEYLITKRQESIRLLDDYLRSVFLETLKTYNSNWNTLKIHEIAKDKKGSMRTGPFGSNLLHGEFVDKGVAVLGIDNAVNNEFKWKQRRFITQEKYEQLKRYTVYPNDLIITIMGTLGRSAVVPKDIPTAINTKHLACITLNQNLVDPYFINYSFQNDPEVISQLRRKTRGAIMAGLNITLIKDIKLKIPPQPLQNKFVKIINAIESQKKNFIKSKNGFDTLFNALSQEYFG